MAATPHPSMPGFFASGSLAIDWTEVRMRANPAYELVLIDRLTDGERQALREVADDPECYGVLRPRADPRLGVKAVSRDTALLLFSLQQAGPLPRYAARSLGEACAAVIGRMVLDGILEIEANGEMVSGPGAWEVLFGANAASNDAMALDANGRLAAMSRRAVEYGAALQISDALALSARLYAYNRIPVSSRWRALLPTEEQTVDYFGLADGPAARSLARMWNQLPESEAWISWRAKNGEHRQSVGGDSSETHPIYKLYVSPACDRLREAVEAIADALAHSHATQWKVGRGIHGLLRPDKMVVYFHRFADLQETAFSIIAGLEGCPPHGVPFTTELGGDGLLSWGVDARGNGRSKPSEDAWTDKESWRGKICDRLALGLVQAGDRKAEHDGESVSAANFAIARLRLEGVDTGTWTPNRDLAWSR